jgi:hypothetical protein
MRVGSTPKISKGKWNGLQIGLGPKREKRKLGCRNLFSKFIQGFIQIKEV